MVLWVIGFPFWWWSHHTSDQDARAEYQHIVLGDSGAASVTLKSHVAVNGRLLGSHILVLREGSTVKYHLIPLVAPGWQEGQPARFVLKVDRLAELQQERTGGSAKAWRPPGQPAPAPIPDWPVLARVGGSLSVTAEQELKKMGVPLTPEAHILEWVRSKEGEPDLQSLQLYRDIGLQIYLVIEGVLSAVVLLVFLMMGFSDWRQARKGTSPKPGG
jgi:hypothetical protein